MKRLSPASCWGSRSSRAGLRFCLLWGPHYQGTGGTWCRSWGPVFRSPSKQAAPYPYTRPLSPAGREGCWNWEQRTMDFSGFSLSLASPRTLPGPSSCLGCCKRTGQLEDWEELIHAPFVILMKNNATPILLLLETGGESRPL